MSNEIKLSPEAQAVVQANEQKSIQDKLSALRNESRLVGNALALICGNDIQIPCGFARPVAELQEWFEAMHKHLKAQIDTLDALLPKPKTDEKAPAVAQDERKPIEAGIVR